MRHPHDPITVYRGEDGRLFWRFGQWLDDLPNSFCGPLRWHKIIWGPKAWAFRLAFPMC